MSKRTERRVAERIARKAERTSQTAQLPAIGAPSTLTACLAPHIGNDASFEPITPTETSQARIAANRLNAQKSTGPSTPQGRAASSVNALKHGLTGNTVLLDSDDAAAYQQRLDAHVEQFKPVTLEERRLVQSIHDADWRLDRVLNLESTIYAKGRGELTGCFDELPESQRKSYIQLETYGRYEKTLRNLQIQESRIQRQRAKDLASLKELLAERKASAERKAQEKAACAPEAPPVGFEFSTSETASPSTQTPQPELVSAHVL